MENIEAIKTKAEQLAAELAANDAANAAEHAAAVALLNRVIEVSKPALRGIGDKLQAADDATLKSGKRFELNRAINLSRSSNHFAFNGDTVLLQTGELKTIAVKYQREDYGYDEYATHISWAGCVEFEGFANWSLHEIKVAMEKIADKIERAGSRADATKAALARAEKMKAIAALL